MIIEITDTAIKINTHYDPYVVSVIKAVPDGRTYDPKTRTWTVVKTADNLRHLEKAKIGNGKLAGLIGEAEAPLKYNEEIWSSIENPKGVSFYAHQKTGIGLLHENDRAAPFWEQGCGKTLPAIMIIQSRMWEIIKKLNDNEVATLIVCPKNVIGSWVRQFSEFSNIEPVVIAGTAKKREKILHGNSSCFLINYDLLPAMQNVLMAKGFQMIVFDESQYIKNPYSQRAKAAYEIAKTIPRRALLTGTPIGNGSLDIFQQFKVLDESIFGTSFYSFRAKYFQDNPWEFKNRKTGKRQTVHDWKIKPGSIDEIKRKIGLRAHRLTKKECLDLPEKIYQTIEVDMCQDQLRAYRQAESEVKIIVNDTEINTRQKIVKMMRLNQICSGHIGSGDDIETFKHNKLIELRRLWEDVGQPKMVVWTVFTHDIIEILNEFSESGAVSVYGGNTAEQNTENIERFQSDPECKVIVCNEKAGGVGITLTASGFVVIYSRSYSLLNRLQLEDRTHRIGQQRNVTYIDLICRGSIECDMLDVVEGKRQVARELLGDESSFSKEILRRFR